MKAAASCICGGVKIEADVGSSVGACHCELCRKWGGSPLLALDGGTGLTIDGEENIATYPSTAWAERGFCRSCGTHLFIRVNDSGRYILPAGLFDLDAGLEFDHQIFVDRRPGYYAFANETTEQTGAEVFAGFGSNP